MSDVIAIIGDNAEVNKALSNLCEKPSIECASHCFNLAVSLFLRDHDEVINKISDIVIKLPTIKYRGKLRQKTDVGPVLKNETTLEQHVRQVEPIYPFASIPVGTRIFGRSSICNPLVVTI